MIDVKQDGNRSIIDVRENIKNGQHPRNDIFEYVKSAPNGTIIEIHLPFVAGPLIEGLKSMGLNVTVKELAEDHVLVMAVKP